MTKSEMRERIAYLESTLALFKLKYDVVYEERRTLLHECAKLEKEVKELKDNAK